MTEEEFEDVKRKIRIRQRCVTDDQIARNIAQADVERLDRAIAEDLQQIDDLERLIDAHWQQVFGLDGAQA